MNEGIRASFLVLLASVLLPFLSHAQDPESPWIPDILAPQYIAVVVEDVDRSVDWYERVFGLRSLGGSQAEDGSWRIENLASATLFVEIIRDDRAQRVDRALGFRKFGFYVWDLEYVADRIESASGDRPRILDFEEYGVRIFQLSDPDGNTIQVSQSLDLFIEKAQAFRDLIEQEDFGAARAMMAPNARRWWDRREGEGMPWEIGPQSGPWAAWDDHFNATKTVLTWSRGIRAATVLIRESNDYYRYLERGAMNNAVTYYFDKAGFIDGMVIRSAGIRPPGRTDEFVAWARQNAAAELAQLMPNGEIDPSGDHPERFRRLLTRWREEMGLDPIE